MNMCRRYSGEIEGEAAHSSGVQYEQLVLWGAAGRAALNSCWSLCCETWSSSKPHKSFTIPLETILKLPL